MSSGRHRRNPAPDEQPWPDQLGQEAAGQLDYGQPGYGQPGYDQPRRRHAADETAPDLPAWRDPAPPAQYHQPPSPPALDETSLDLPPWRSPFLRDPAPQPAPPPAPDETSLDLPAWREPARHEPAPRRPPRREPPRRPPAPARRPPAADETSVDLVPAETSFDLPALSARGPRRPRADETVVDLPAWDERPRRDRDRGRTRPPGRPGPGKPKKAKSKGPLRLMIAAAVVLVIGIGVSVYGLTTRTTVAGAQYTPPSVGSSVPNAKPDPAALALSRSTPVKIQIPSIGVSAPIEQVGLLTNGEVQTPPLTVHNLTGWYKYGPTPGEDGASVILGHVDDYQGLSVFYYLKDLTKGDQISVTLADGITANFVVDGLQKASKDDFPTQQVYGKIGYPGLRLITCGGTFDSATGHYDANIIVYAHLVHSATT
jgi:sortase (surface protein transpeptidase)